jgi:hypothetical protein
LSPVKATLWQAPALLKYYTIVEETNIGKHPCFLRYVKVTALKWFVVQAPAVG